MTDNDIIEFFSDKNGNINSNKCRLIENYPEYCEYVKNRYSEFISYKLALKCIFNHLDDLPKCKNCGETLTSIKQYCSTKCQLSDPNFINYRNTIIDYDARTKKFKSTCQERYGVDVPAQNKQIIKKMTENHDYDKTVESYKRTCQERYGVDNSMQVKEFRDKAMQTKLSNRPNDPNNSKKIKQTMVERYGSTGTLGSDILRSKVEQTKYDRYGNSNYVNPNKTRETNLERYGVPNVTGFGTEKHKQAIYDKYGVEHYSQSKEFMKNRQHKYEYDGIGFDSLYEIEFYKYHKNLGHNIIHEPCQFSYVYNGEKHVYNPDFMVDGVLYEIKGRHFFDNDKMINPFDRSQDGLYEAKHQCMIDNNVVIVFDDYLDIQNISPELPE